MLPTTPRKIGVVALVGETELCKEPFCRGSKVSCEVGERGDCGEGLGHEVGCEVGHLGHEVVDEVLMKLGKVLGAMDMGGTKAPVDHCVVGIVSPLCAAETFAETVVETFVSPPL